MAQNTNNYGLDVLGEALLDYQNGKYTEDIKTFSSLDEEDSIPLPYLFRDFNQMPKLEQKALELCKGRVLDIGAGAGSHSLFLQKKGLEVTALDSSPGAINVCEQRGIKKTIVAEILNYEKYSYDTLLLLMNGIGIVGSLDYLDSYLTHFKKLLSPNGQILLDSSDLIYMFDQEDDGGYWVPDNGTYYGQVQFQLSYKGEKGEPFHWLYIDFKTLKEHCEKVNFNCKLVSKGDHYDYLAKLTLRP